MRLIPRDSAKASCRISARSLDLRAADYGGPALAARMHVAERERVVAVELPVPEAVGVGEDKPLLSLPVSSPMNGSSVFSPPPETVVTPQNRRPPCPVMSITSSFSRKAALSQVPRTFAQCPPFPPIMLSAFPIHLPLTSVPLASP